MLELFILFFTVVVYIFIMDGIKDLGGVFRAIKRWLKKLRGVFTTTVLDRWNITDVELTEMVFQNPSLRGMMMGYIAEYKLKAMLKDNPHVSDVKKYDDHDRKKKGDLLVTYKGHDFRIECKSLQTNSIELKDDVMCGNVQCDASDKRAVELRDGVVVKTTCLKVGTFDVLAANLFAFNGKWDFGFTLNRDLPRTEAKKYSKEVQDQLLKTSIPICWPLDWPFVSDPFVLFDVLIREDSSK